MIFKMKLVKTEFHSGRLLVVFNVAEFLLGNAVATLDNSPYAHRHIIDIREANEFTFSFPFVSSAPYKTTLNFNTSAVGYFGVYVLDALVAPSTVSQSVSIILEKCAGPDFELAVPSVYNYTYMSGITPQSGNAFVSEPTNVCSNVSSTVGSSAWKLDNSMNSLHCVGEKISSLRTLLKLPVQNMTTLADPVDAYFNILPFCVLAGNITGAVSSVPDYIADLYAKFACCYTYARGGVRIKFIDNASVTTSGTIAVYLDTRTTTSTHYAAFEAQSGNGLGTTLNSVRNGMPVMYYRLGYSGEVQVPQYMHFHSRLNSYCMMNQINSYDAGFEYLAPKVSLTRTVLPSGNADCSFTRSMADDGNFGGFLSVPPMLAIQSL
jgi:hypothetical protein